MEKQWKHHSLSWSIAQRSRGPYGPRWPTWKKSGFTSQYRNFSQQIQNQYSLEYNLARGFISLHLSEDSQQTSTGAEKRPVSGENIVFSQKYRKTKEKEKNCSEIQSDTKHKTTEMNIKPVHEAVRSAPVCSLQKYSELSGLNKVPYDHHPVRKEPRKFSFLADELHFHMKGSKSDKLGETDVQDKRTSVKSNKVVEDIKIENKISTKKPVEIEKMCESQCLKKLKEDVETLKSKNINESYDQSKGQRKEGLHVCMKEYQNVKNNIDIVASKPVNNSSGSKSHKGLETATSSFVYANLHDIQAETCEQQVDTKRSAFNKEKNLNTNIMVGRAESRTSENQDGTVMNELPRSFQKRCTDMFMDQFAKDVAAVLSLENMSTKQQEQNQTQLQNIHLATDNSIQHSLSDQNINTPRRTQGFEMSPYWDKAIDEFLKSHVDFFIAAENTNENYPNVENCSMYIGTAKCATSDQSRAVLKDHPREKTETPSPVLLPFNGYTQELSNNEERGKPACENIPEKVKQSQRKQTHNGRTKPYWEMTLAARNKFEREKKLFETAKRFLGKNFEEKGKKARKIKKPKNQALDEFVTVQENTKGHPFNGSVTCSASTCTEDDITGSFGRADEVSSSDCAQTEKERAIIDETILNRRTEDQSKKLEIVNSTLDRNISIAKLRLNEKTVVETKGKRGRKRKKSSDDLVDSKSEELNNASNKIARSMEACDAKLLEIGDLKEVVDRQKTENKSVDFPSVSGKSEVRTKKINSNADDFSGEVQIDGMCTPNMKKSDFEKDPKLELIDVVKFFNNVKHDPNTTGEYCLRSKNAKRGKKRKILGPKTWKSLHCTLKSLSKKRSNPQLGKRQSDVNASIFKTSQKKSKKSVSKVQILSLRENLKTIPKRMSEDETCSDNDTCSGEELAEQNCEKGDHKYENNTCEIFETNGTSGRSEVCYKDQSLNSNEKRNKNKVCGKKGYGSHRYPSETMICQFCGTEETSKAKLKIHIKEYHPYRCFLCLKIFPDKKTNSSHFWSHQKSYYRCTLCNVNLKNSHIRDLHLNKKEHLEKEQRNAEMNAATASIKQENSSGLQSSTKVHIRDLHLNKKEHLEREQHYAEVNAATASIMEENSPVVADQKTYYRCILCNVNFRKARTRDLHLIKKEHLERERSAEMNAATATIMEESSSDFTSTLDEVSDTDILCQIGRSFSVFNRFRDA